MFFASLCLIAYTAGVSIFGIIVGIDIGFCLGRRRQSSPPTADGVEKILGRELTPDERRLCSDMVAHGRSAESVGRELKEAIDSVNDEGEDYGDEEE